MGEDYETSSFYVGIEYQYVINIQRKFGMLCLYDVLMIFSQGGD